MTPATGRPDSRLAPVPLATGKLGIRLVLLSLSMLFAASIAGFLVVRSRAAVWPPPGLPVLPHGLWLSTVILLVSSLTMQAALGAARRGDQRTMRGGLAATTALGVAFLISQTVNWFVLVAANLTPKTTLYGFTFFILTGLHAAHVIGGIVPLAVVARRAFAGRYTQEFHPGVEYCAMYWHFLDAVWLVLFCVLYLFN